MDGEVCTLLPPAVAPSVSLLDLFTVPGGRHNGEGLAAAFLPPMANRQLSAPLPLPMEGAERAPSPPPLLEESSSFGLGLLDSLA